MTEPQVAPHAPQVDVRGPRFGAAVTTVVLLVVLATGSGWLLAAQAVVFALGAVAGLRRAPYGLLFARLIRPRLGPPSAFEDEAPPRFAQGVGLLFALVGAVGYLAGLPAVGIAATALALAAAFLNAAFGFCLGCEMYLLAVRLRKRSA
ncbi:MAG: DUF4395 domain-containing protein [Catenulispora sp.]|nr:DUF4395 domain-containing protein [Catenulispora sp.]